MCLDVPIGQEDLPPPCRTCRSLDEQLLACSTDAEIDRVLDLMELHQLSRHQDWMFPPEGGEPRRLELQQKLGM